MIARADRRNQEPKYSWDQINHELENTGRSILTHEIFTDIYNNSLAIQDLVSQHNPNFIELVTQEQLDNGPDEIPDDSMVDAPAEPPEDKMRKQAMTTAKKHLKQ